MDELHRLSRRVLMGSFVGTVAPDWARRELENGLGGVCLFGTNTRLDAAGPQQSGEQLVTALATQLHQGGARVVVALDEEGGDVTRLHYASGSPHAGHAVLGRADDIELTRAVAGALGSDLRRAGVDLDFGPVADVNSERDNPVIGTRSFGAEPGLVARHTAAWVQGLQQAGVGACLKHFPGHGATTVDSHLGLPTVHDDAEVLRARDLIPFAAGVRAGAVAVMTSHLMVPALDAHLPATFSAAVLGLLRSELGFEGLLASDALDMVGASGGRGVPAAGVLALRAGVDLLCLGSDGTADQLEAASRAIVDAVRQGELSIDRLRQAAARVETAVTSLASLREQAGDVADDGSSAAAATAALQVDGPLPPMLGARVVRLDAGSNQAVGEVPWGVLAGLSVLVPSACTDVAVDVDLTRLGPEPVVALVREVHRHPPLLAALRRLVAHRPDLVVVDMGWGEADLNLPVTVVRSWGASAASTAAVDRLLVEGRS